MSRPKIPGHVLGFLDDASHACEGAFGRPARCDRVQEELDQGDPLAQGHREVSDVRTVGVEPAIQGGNGWEPRPFERAELSRAEGAHELEIALVRQPLPDEDDDDGSESSSDVHRIVSVCGSGMLLMRVLGEDDGSVLWWRKSASKVLSSTHRKRLTCDRSEEPRREGVLRPSEGCR